MLTQPRLEVRGDSLTYVGLGIGALGLVVTVVGLGEKVTIGEIHPYTVLSYWLDQLAHAIKTQLKASKSPNMPFALSLW